MKYTLTLDDNGYILSIANTDHDNVELNLDNIDTKHVNAYEYQNGTLVLDEVRLKQMIDNEKYWEELAKMPTEADRLDAIDSAIADIAEMLTGGNE